MKKVIVPAIIAKSQEKLEQSINKVKDYAKLLQLDIMDGLFVPNHSIDFDFKLSPNIKFEAHLMISNPVEWIKKHWEEVHTILVHVESCRDLEAIIKLVGNKRKTGFVLNPDTPLQTIQKYLDKIQQVLIMTVNPGFYGSKFLPSALDKVRELRKLKPDLDIEVDGGITSDTIKQVDEVGANMFVSGSFIMKSPDAGAAIQTLRNLVE